ncbi:MAG: helix-turn-helix domain-containing protein [Candidatus Bathyarchaeia archaeon]
MAVEDSEVSALIRLGLTEYESRIYLTLVRMGPLRASEVSFFGHVPRTKTYGAIRELERKGLLSVIPGKPELYAPSNPVEVLVPMIERLRREIEEADGVVQKLIVSYESGKLIRRGVPKEATEFWRIEGRRNIIDKVSQMLSDSKKSVKCCVSAQGLVRMYKAHYRVLEAARKRGVRVRVMSAGSPKSEVAQELSEVIELKQSNKHFKASLISVDGKEMLVVESSPDDAKIDYGSDTAFWTRNKIFTELYDELFDRLWSTSK